MFLGELLLEILESAAKFTYVEEDLWILYRIGHRDL
jgi:hypothetical protein